MADFSEATLSQAAALLEGSPSWTIFTHQKIDGDALGSASALFEAGRLQGKRVAWMGPDPALPQAYLFLSHTGDYRCFDGAFAFDGTDLYIFLDSANETRSVGGLDARAPEARILNIDHHEDNSLYGTLNCVDPSSSSTSELVLRVMQAGGWALSLDIAESLYVGIWTDTGGFAHSNATARTHRLAADLLELGVDPARIDDRINQTRSPEGMALWGRALSHIRVFGPRGEFAIAWLSRADFGETGAASSETDGLPTYLMRLRGVCLTVLLSEMESGGVKASFRSTEGIFPAAEMARRLGGGGHPRAAGATLDGCLSDWLAAIPPMLEARYAEWAAAHR